MHEYVGGCICIAHMRYASTFETFIDPNWQHNHLDNCFFSKPPSDANLLELGLWCPMNYTPDDGSWEHPVGRLFGSRAWKPFPFLIVFWLKLWSTNCAQHQIRCHDFLFMQWRAFWGTSFVPTSEEGDPSRLVNLHGIYCIVPCEVDARPLLRPCLDLGKWFPCELSRWTIRMNHQS